MKYTKETWPNEWPNFSFDELKCQHTGECDVHPATMDKLQAVRTTYGQPMRITSGYRAPTHPIELAKARPGSHSLGQAVDVACDGQQAYKLVRLAIAAGFTGIGISQSGSKRFIHLDDVQQAGWTRPCIWSY